MKVGWLLSGEEVRERNGGESGTGRSVETDDGQPILFQDRVYDVPSMEQRSRPRQQKMPHRLLRKSLDAFDLNRFEPFARTAVDREDHELLAGGLLDRIVDLRLTVSRLLIFPPEAVDVAEKQIFLKDLVLQQVQE